MRYFDLEEKILSNSNFETNIIGHSLLGQPIYCAHVGGKVGRQIIVQCAIHAREYITAWLGIYFAERFAQTNSENGAYFIFNSNPDGMRLAIDGVEWVECEKRKNFLLKVNGGKDFSQYKANANAVDLNTNFPANWGSGTQNVTSPSPANYIGKRPMSERETIALMSFTEQIKPTATISLHTKGEVIYYGFDGQNNAERERDFRIANELAKATKYPPILTIDSAGGYKDWCIKSLHIPAFTIEVGNDALSHPLRMENLSQICEQTDNLIAALFSALLDFS